MGNFSKFNSLLKSANTLKALQKNVLLYNLMTTSARFLKSWLSLIKFLKKFKFEKFLIYVLLKIQLKLNTCQLSFIFLNRKCNPKR